MIKTIPVGMLETNCYLVQLEENGRVFVIDPGDNAEEIIPQIRNLSPSETVILLTHAHFDHIGATAAIHSAFNAPCYVNIADKPLFLSKDNCYPPYIPPVKNLPEVITSITYKEFTIIPTPGHTPGGVSFYFPSLNALFSGDTLFASGIGRTDFPGGNYAELIRSIKEKLFTLPDSVKVYPGHGSSTSIDKEKRVNPYI